MHNVNHNLFWEVELKDKTKVKESEGKQYRDINIDDINKLEVFSISEPKAVIYYVENDKIEIHDTSEKKNPATYEYDKYSDILRLSFYMYKGHSFSRLCKRNRIKTKPIFFKKAFTDYDFIAKTRITQIEGYFVGFENEYLVDDKPIKFKFVVGIAKNFNTLTGKYFYAINKGIIKLSGDLGHKLEIFVNDEIAQHIVIDKKDQFYKEFHFIQ